MANQAIVLATANPHKVAELREIFARAGGSVLGLGDLPARRGGFREPVESGDTFEANTAIKAAAYAAQTGRQCLADDSGLQIDALGGRPGVISSHYCTDGRETGLSREERDRLNNERVLKELERVPEARRSARFVCVMALADADGKIVATSRGEFEGRIGVPPRVPSGGNGFGYDPLFLVAPGFERTGAELASGEKNRLSHRAAAAMSMADHFRSRL